MRVRPHCGSVFYPQIPGRKDGCFLLMAAGAPNEQSALFNLKARTAINKTEWASLSREPYQTECVLYCFAKE